jgi:hypothetical protein
MSKQLLRTARLDDGFRSEEHGDKNLEVKL